MSNDVDQLAGQLGTLQAERAALQVTRTRDDADRAAAEYATAVRKTHAEIGGFVIGGAIIGDPLQSVLHAFIVSRPEFDAWLTEQARTIADNLTDRQKSQRLAKLDGQIAQTTAKLREARKAQALERIEAEFAGEAA